MSEQLEYAVPAEAIDALADDDDLEVQDTTTTSRTVEEKAVPAAAHPQSHPHPVLSTTRSLWIVAICTLGMVLNTSTSTSVAVALPTIGKELNIDQDQLQWIVSAYSLSAGCLLIFLGRLSDLYGRKRFFIGGAVWFALFSLGCGLAKDEITIDVLRGFQGIGASACIPAALGILAHSFPPSTARSVAFATFSAGAPIGAGVGTVLGGVLTTYASDTWRATFWLTTGLALLCALGGLLVLPADLPSAEPDKRVDWLGAALVTVGLVLVTFALAEGEIAPDGWKTPYIIALLILGILLVAAFLVWQHHLESIQLAAPSSPAALARARSAWSPPPLMKLSLWKRAQGKFAVIQMIAFLNWFSFLSWYFWTQLYYQDYLQLSPIDTMLRFLPMSIAGILCNVIVALLIGTVDMIYLIVAGTLLTASAPLLLALINPSSPYWAFGFPASILSVTGADFTMASGSLFVAKISLPHEQSLSGGLFQTLMQLGTALGLAITTIVHNRVVRAHAAHEGVVANTLGTNAPADAQLAGYRAAQWTAFAFSVLASVLAAVFFRGVGIVGHRPSVPKPKSAVSAPTDSEDAEKASHH